MEVDCQQARNGLHRPVVTTDETASVWPCALGGTTGGPRMDTFGSGPSHLLPPMPFARVHAPQHLVRFSDAGRPSAPSASQPRERNHTRRAARNPRDAGATTVRTEDTPIGTRKVRVRRTMEWSPGNGHGAGISTHDFCSHKTAIDIFLSCFMTLASNWVDWLRNAERPAGIGVRDFDPSDADPMLVPFRGLQRGTPGLIDTLDNIRFPQRGQADRME